MVLMAAFRRWRVAASLLGVVALALGFRLWKIRDLFSVFHDYDPGAYSLGVRFITEGLVPYRDFVLVHPPLYDYVLAAVYDVSGYDLVHGRYLSVALSFICVLLVYEIGRRLYDSRVAVMAALIFAVEPMMVYLGRRCVQEMLGLTLILAGVLLAFGHLQTGGRRRLLFAGICLGLAIAVKYVFVPAVVGVVLGLAALSWPDSLRARVSDLGDLVFWGLYVAIAGAFYALLFMLEWVLGVPVSLPLMEPLQANAGDVSVVVMVLVLPLFLAARARNLALPFRAWAGAFMVWVRGTECRLLLCGIVVGFLSVTGYFLVTVPGEFVRQTLLWQQNRPAGEFPSLLALARIAPLVPGYARMACLSVLAAIPVALVLLNRRPLGKGDPFVVIVVSVTAVLSQGFFQLPRYYAPMFPFVIMGVAALVQTSAGIRSSGWGRVGLYVPLTLVLLSGSLSASLLNNYSGYDAFGTGPASSTRTLYDQTTAFLRDGGAKKVFTLNPIFAAMSDELDSTVDFDTFALLWLEKRPAKRILEDVRAEGVDCVVVDPWIRQWGDSYKDGADALLSEIRRTGHLIGILNPGSPLLVEVYRLGAAPEVIVNGDFAYWSDYEGMSIPLGWNPVLIGGEGDSADIRAAGLSDEGGVRFIVYEDGLTEPGATSTHAGLSRRMAFPRTDVTVTVMPGLNTESLGATPLGPAIHFLDGEGHSVVLGFSDKLEEEQVAVCGECGHVAVMRPAPLYRWSEHSIDVAKYWQEAGWEIPEEVTLLVVLSAHADYPGYYTFHVKNVTVDAPA